MPQRHTKAPQLSRRDMLALLAVAGGASALATCGGLAGWALLSSQRAAQAAIPTIAPSPVPTATPSPTPVPPPIVPRSAWGAEPPNHEAANEFGYYTEDNRGGWRDYGAAYPDIYRTIVVHHSVIYTGGDISTVYNVQKLHMGDRAWADIGYHFLIGRRGDIYEGRDLHVRGTHVAGYNTGSVGVCVLGNTTEMGLEEAQWQALGACCRWLMQILPVTHLAGHREFNPQTECPGVVMWNALDQLAQALGLLRGVGGYEEPVAAAQDATCDCCHLL